MYIHVFPFHVTGGTLGKSSPSPIPTYWDLFFSTLNYTLVFTIYLSVPFKLIEIRYISYYLFNTGYPSGQGWSHEINYFQVVH